MKQNRLRQPLVWLLITAHVILIYGCSTMNRVTLPGNAIPVGSEFTVVQVVLKDGKLIEFDGEGGRYVEKLADGKPYRVIVGTADGKDIEVDPENVLELKAEHKESSGVGTFFLGFLVGIPVGGLLLLLIALAGSSH